MMELKSMLMAMSLELEWIVPAEEALSTMIPAVDMGPSGDERMTVIFRVRKL